MARRQSKRDTTIARASLLVYPPAHAYEQWMRNAEWTRRGETRIDVPSGEHQFYFVFRKTNDEAGVFEGHYRANNFLPHNIFLAEKRVTWKEKIAAPMWMTNFAKVCLETHTARTANEIYVSTLKLLRAKDLNLNLDWAGRVARIVHDHAKSTPTFNIPPLHHGYLENANWDLMRDENGITSLDLIRKIILEAKQFEPTARKQGAFMRSDFNDLEAGYQFALNSAQATD